MKMPTVMFISRENFMLSWVEHEKSSITLGQEHSTLKASSKVRMTRNDITEQQTNENGTKRNAVRFISFSECHKTERA